MVARAALLSSASLVFLAPLHAQVSEVWSTSVGGGGLGAQAVDSSGAVYLAGVSSPAGDGRLVKLDPQGNVLWSAVEPNPANEGASVVGVEPGDAHAWVALRGFSNGDVRVLRFDAAGQLVTASAPWDGAGHGADDVLAGVAFDAAGNAFVAGKTWSGLPTRDDALVLSYDPSGVLRWAATFDGGAGLRDFAASIVVDAAGDAYVSGGADEPYSGSGYGLGFVARVSAAGQVDWVRTFEGTAGARAHGLARDPSTGDVVACGISGTETEGLLVRYDAAGELLWSRSHSIGIVASFEAVALDAAGAALVAGYQQVGTGVQPSANVLAFKYDAGGALLWQREWDSPFGLADVGREIAVDAAGNASLGAWSYATASPSSHCAALVRYDPDGNLRWSGVLTAHGEGALVTSVLGRADGSLLVGGPTSVPATSQYGGFAIALADQARGFCFGDASAGPCPCGNASEPGTWSGCANSSGSGARLADSGVASLGADTLSMTASGTTPTATCVFLQGSAQVAPVPFGDGLRCVGGSLLRLYVLGASGGVASAPGAGDPGFSARSAALGDALVPGATRYHQTHYRDADLGFCAAPEGATWNASGALAITWVP